MPRKEMIPASFSLFLSFFFKPPPPAIHCFTSCKVKLSSLSCRGKSISPKPFFYYSNFPIICSPTIPSFSTNLFFAHFTSVFFFYVYTLNPSDPNSCYFFLFFFFIYARRLCLILHKPFHQLVITKHFFFFFFFFFLLSPLPPPWMVYKPQARQNKFF